MNDPYKDPILAAYARIIQAKQPRITTVFYGEPMRIAASNLPALVLTKSRTSVRNLTNTEDVHEVGVQITIVTDVRDSVSEDKTMVKGFTDLYNICEGRDEDYKLNPDSILGIIRSNVELDPSKQLRTDLNTATTVNYGMTLGKRGEESWSIEATIELIAHFTQLRA